MTLATRPHADSHQVCSHWHLDVVLSLQFALLGYVLLRWLLHQEGSVANDRLGITLTRNYDLVDLGFPEGFDDCAGVTMLVKRVSIDLAQGLEVLAFGPLILLDCFNFNLSLRGFYCCCCLSSSCCIQLRLLLCLCLC